MATLGIAGPQATRFPELEQPLLPLEALQPTPSDLAHESQGIALVSTRDKRVSVGPLRVAHQNTLL